MVKPTFATCISGMQVKPITAIIVLLLVVASLSVAGCTTSNTNQTPSATPSEATHNTTLENYLAGAKNVSYADKNLTYKAWEVTWTNSTSVRLEDTFQNKSTNVTFNEVATYTIFPATQAATDYVNAMNKTTYSLASTVNSTATGYQKVTGHLPVVYKAYQWNEGNPLNISEYKAHFIAQFDNLVKIATIKALSVG
jgi:hypothetical protein